MYLNGKNTLSYMVIFFFRERCSPPKKKKKIITVELQTLAEKPTNKNLRFSADFFLVSVAAPA